MTRPFRVQVQLLKSLEQFITSRATWIQAKKITLTRQWQSDLIANSTKREEGKEGIAFPSTLMTACVSQIFKAELRTSLLTGDFRVLWRCFPIDGWEVGQIAVDRDCISTAELWYNLRNPEPHDHVLGAVHSPHLTWVVSFSNNKQLHRAIRTPRCATSLRETDAAWTFVTKLRSHCGCRCSLGATAIFKKNEVHWLLLSFVVRVRVLRVDWS